MSALDKKLWNKIKKEIEEKYDKRWNAYYSGMLVQEYKKRGGKFADKTAKIQPLKRWFAEKWKNINTKNSTVVYRPTKRITKDTPVTLAELSKKEIDKKIKEKTRHPEKNLSPFNKKI